MDKNSKNKNSKEVSEKPFFNADTRRLHADSRGLSRQEYLRPSALHLRKSAFKRLFQSSSKRKAQSTLEYAMVIACIVAALIGMQIYIKRSIQGRLKNAADDIGEQYSAKTTTSNLTQVISSNVNITGAPEFITVNGEDREIMGITRNEAMTISVGEGSEQTGRLSDENLFE